MTLLVGTCNKNILNHKFMYMDLFTIYVIKYVPKPMSTVFV